MIPNVPILNEEIAETTYYGKTYKIIFNDDECRIAGYIDNLESIKQAIYLILNTERYKHVIYSWDYGVELLNLYGKPLPYVLSELPRRITEALTQDNRIENVTDFEFTKNRNAVHVTFTVVTSFGNIPTELEVDV